MSSETDYRMERQSTHQPGRTFLYPLTDQNRHLFHILYDEMCEMEGKEPKPFTIHFQVC